jgi:hypothetical protein
MEAEIARLRSLALDALRRHWRVVFGRTPPADLSKDLLGRMIAWRMQEQAFGGLDRESLRFLEGLARHGGSPRRRLKPGTVLVRDYQGQRHTVTVAADGFDWQGTTYPSLSAIARTITGTAWSGPRFFALARRNGSPTRSNNRKVVRGVALGGLRHLRSSKCVIRTYFCKPDIAQRDSTAWLGMEDSKCAGRPARSRWCKSTTMKE